MVKNKHILSTVILVMAGLLMLFPIYILFMSGFKAPEEIFQPNLMPGNPTLQNFSAMFNAKFIRGILNSLVVSTTVTVVAMLLHAMCGYALSRFDFPLKKLLFSTIVSTLMIPMTTIFVPLFMVCKALGLTNNMWGMIVPALFNAYGIFLFKQFYDDFPKELEEAAEVEGCSKARVFFTIALPLSKPMMVPLTIAFFLGSWNNYLWPLIINKKQQYYTIQVVLANMVSGYNTPWNELIAAAAMAAIPVFVLFLLLQGQLHDGIKTTGIK